MSVKSTLLVLAGAALAAVAPARTNVEWSTLGNETAADGSASYTQRFAVTADRPIARLAFNQFARRMSTVNPADTLIEIVPGYYAVASPRLTALSPGETVDIDIVTRGSLTNICYAPDGVHGVDLAGQPFAVDFSRADITASPAFYATAKTDRMPYGEAVFARNAARGVPVAVEPYDVVPSFKRVAVADSALKTIKGVRFMAIDDPRPEYMRVEVADGLVSVAGNDTLRARLRLQPLLEGGALPDAVIEDWPDFGYRGLMIDIARNFQPVGELKRVVDLMARYGLNTLHLHFADDEAWRIEIPGLPELTEVGGRRGYSVGRGDDFLPQIFCGDGNPDNPEGTSNGFYAADEFVDLLRYAAARGVRVVPEVESPGHARAAIRAMEKRFATRGDDRFRLVDPADTSRYTSAQAFHDNVMNPALPGPVRFMTHVAKELKRMYGKAGLTMPALHIGGDEVARGAWTGSPVAREWLKANGLENERLLHLKFVRELVDELAALDIPVSGWQEIAVGHDEAYNGAVRPHVFSVNCWSTLGRQKSVTMQSAEAGFPTVLSNVDHYYLDMCYSYHPLERGLTWGGTVDEFDALHGYPYELCPVDSAFRKNIAGVSGQLFSETMRSPAMLESFLLPKMLGLAERAWNADSTYTDSHFNSVISRREMPWWKSGGYNFHVGQPGIMVEESGMVTMNRPYGDIPAKIHYTLDGTEPTAESAVYTIPFPAPKDAKIRARLFIAPDYTSLTTFDKPSE